MVRSVRFPRRMWEQLTAALITPSLPLSVRVAIYYHDYIQVSNHNNYPSRSNKWALILKICVLNFFYYLNLRNQMSALNTLLTFIMIIVYHLVNFFFKVIFLS